MGQTFHTEALPTASNGASGGNSQDHALVAGYMSELDTMRATVSGFPNRDPSDVLVMIAGVAGRLAEIRAELYRSNTQRCAALRTREVDPLREDLDLQFRIWSRKIALMEWELKLSGGAV